MNPHLYTCGTAALGCSVFPFLRTSAVRCCFRDSPPLSSISMPLIPFQILVIPTTVKRPRVVSSADVGRRDLVRLFSSQLQ
jgi:hypothetical protein